MNKKELECDYDGSISDTLIGEIKDKGIAFGSLLIRKDDNPYYRLVSSSRTGLYLQCDPAIGETSKLLGDQFGGDIGIVFNDTAYIKILDIQSGKMIHVHFMSEPLNTSPSVKSMNVNGFEIKHCDLSDVVCLYHRDEITLYNDDKLKIKYFIDESIKYIVIDDKINELIMKITLPTKEEK